MPKRDPNHYCVYVVRLDEAVFKVKKFREANPDADPTKQCFYVGKSGHSPDVRYRQHKAGIKSGKKIVTRFGMYLRRRMCNLNLSHDEAVRLEKELAYSLRAKGHGVWQN